jgi:uncharacterized damage-inducible protein DinB
MTPIADLIMRYEAGGAFLVAAVQWLEPEQAHERVAPGVWSIAELVAHMYDSDLVGMDRMKRVIAEEEPVLLAYDQEAWILRLRSDTMPYQEAAELFAANRKWMARVFRQTPETDFNRAGIHSERGRMTLAELVSGYVNHLDHHLRFLYAKRGALGVGIPPRYTRN